MASETPREIVKRCMPNVKYEHVDGIMYQQFERPCMQSESHKKMRQLVLYPNDVYSTGWPRSGNHWTYYVLDMILKQSANLTSKSFANAFPDAFSDQQLDEFNAAPPPRLFCSHARLHRFPDIARKNTCVIYVIRNPKDAMVSLYAFLCDLAEEHRFTGTWDEYFEAQLGGEMPFGPWFDHVLDFEKFMADNPNVPVYIHQFEEMKQKPIECVRKLCSFLGQPDTLAEKIVASAGIDSLKTVIKRQAESNDKYYKGKEPTFIRKGESGSWKHHFTVAQNERFDREFEKKMKGSKLAELVRQYL